MLLFTEEVKNSCLSLVLTCVCVCAYRSSLTCCLWILPH